MKKLELNILSIFLLLLVFFVIVNDYLCFILKVNYSFVLYLISLIITVVAFYISRKNISVKKVDFNKFDVIFYIIIAMVIGVRIAIPDSAFDTLNYHLYIQERLFSNNTSYNFFPARWINTFSLPLADRIHFLFRNIFGYRLGIMANIIILIIVYYQVKKILKYFIQNETYVSLISCVILITEQLLSNMLSYYVDLMPIPFFLEIIIIMLYNKKVNNFTNYIVLFMAGILISLKISNAFLVIPLAIIYLIKYRKNINYKTILIGIPIAIMPFFIYLLNNYIQTGNPVFPFYNSIFNSKYLPNTNWIEDYYGPKGKGEKLFWPIYMMFYPRRAFDSDYYYGRIGFGYFISLLLLIMLFVNVFIKKKKIQQFDKLNILFVVFCLIWSNMMMGYIRYALVLEVISGVIIAISLYDSFKNKKRLYLIISVLCIYALAHTSFLTMGDMLGGSKELSWRKPMSVYNLSDIDKENIAHLFDNSKNYDKKLARVDCIGIADYNSGYAALLSDSKRILNLKEGFNTNYGKNQLEKSLKKCKNLYTVTTRNTIDRVQERLKTTNYKTTGKEIRFKTDFLSENNELILLEIRKE